MIKELATSFKAILYERIVSPLSGAFVFSWCIFNWKMLAILFAGKMPVTEKIELIEQKYLLINTIWWGPLISTAFLIIVYPWISNIAFWLWQFSTSFKVKAKIKFENETPLTLNQSIEIRKEIQRKNLEFNELLLEKNEKIRDLELSINLLNKAASEKQKTNINRIEVDDTKTENNGTEHQDWHQEFTERVSKGSYLDNHFSTIIDATIKESALPIETDTLRYFIAAEIVERDDDGSLFLTDKGRYFANLWTIHED